ncbi:MAG: hypothetical protein FD178_274 [Ignavibacteria bacterium]|nr:MAG: hypothetical protein FD178_274 [Ignavibacteria bacterium]
MKTLLFCLLSLISISVFAQGQNSFNEYSEMSKLESLVPIRPGNLAGQPFWNEKSTMFKYAPSFNNNINSWIIVNPKYYKYSAFSFSDNKTYTFTADNPYEALSPIWSKLPNGEVYLKVEAVSLDEKDFVLAGSRLFYKTAVFTPPYTEAKYSYKEAFKKGLKFMFNQIHIKDWVISGKPNHESHKLYCYSALEVGSVINAMILYNKYFPNNDTSLIIARKAADYLITNSEPKGVALEHFPQVYEGNNLTAGKFAKEVIMTEPASTGKSYLDLFDVTRDEKYLNAAKNIANTYCKTQLSSGTWNIRIDKATGLPTTEEFCVPINIVNFLSVMVNKYHFSQYKANIDLAINWIWENPMKTYNWSGQFEDVGAVKPYQNLSKYEASWFAQYLLENSGNDDEYITQAKELIAFCEDQFVVWENPKMYDNWGNSTNQWHTPAVLEQYKCYVPIDASAVQMIITFYKAYKTTNEPIYREKAIALANSVVNTQKENGMIPTFWVPGFDEFWNNCMVSSLTMLDNISPIKNKIL